MIKLCAFDFDSTLIDAESIDILAKAYNVGDAIKSITDKAMNGEIDFFESLLERVALLKGMPLNQVQKCFENLPLMNGAIELFEYLKSQNIKIIVLSGGFHEGIKLMQKKLHFDLAFANFLHHKDGVLSGKVGGEVMFGDSKGKILQNLKTILNLNIQELMCVGDGANDIAMFNECGLKIAFCAKEILKSHADFCIDKKDLTEIKKVVK
ncbi:phosphoserine phosphatase SerB [Campylobacter volucris]|uniref:Phosphoserine phosphatase n=1 Tax=Campylobacter volucris TaxID=1031542 RepID=A0A5C7E259_9BACT|nr:phosphoserine phosphatase SerB [Campylobacter volucris]TXE87652.1 phosphoserine phosphatase SerB [Campylobacter volucris]